MKRLTLITFALFILPILCPAEIVKIKLSDGDTLTGCLSLPDQEEIGELVIFIPGTGPNTYDNHRKFGTYGREKIFQQAPFDDLDKNNDGVISKEDFQLQSQPLYEKLLKTIPNGDDDYIWNNYFRVTSAWLKAHFALESNKTRMLRLNIPIYIFHGDRDASAPLDEVYAVKDKFEQYHKTNLHVYIFRDHDHDLNYIDYIYKQQIPEGLQKIFDIAEQLKK